MKSLTDFKEIKKINVKRSIIAVGNPGVGKSKLLNHLIGHEYFMTSSSINTCTEKVVSSDWIKVKFKNKTNKDIPFELKAFDTPGITDSDRQSITFLNEIAQTIKTSSFNLIIIMIEFGRLSYGNLKLIQKLINDFGQLSLMIVVNKVPTKELFERKVKRGENSQDRDKLLNEIFTQLSETIGNSSMYKLFLENDDLDDDINEEKYNHIKQIIFSSEDEDNLIDSNNYEIIGSLEYINKIIWNGNKFFKWKCQVKDKRDSKK